MSSSGRWMLWQCLTRMSKNLPYSVVNLISVVTSRLFKHNVVENS